MRNKLFEPITIFGSVLERMLTKSVLWDFMFIVQDELFEVHKNIMAATSPMFRSMVTIDMAENEKGESKIDHIKPEIFNALLKIIDRLEIEKQPTLKL